MSKKARIVCIVIIIFVFWIWFFAWREYTKYQIREWLKEAFAWFSNAFNQETSIEDKVIEDEDVKDEVKKADSDKTIKDKEIKEESKKEQKKEIFETLKKWETKEFQWKFESSDIEAEVSLWDVSFTDEIMPPEPRQSFYTYFPKQENKTFAVLYMNIKNTWWKSFNLSDVIKDLYDTKCNSKAIFWWKYEYTVDVVAELKKDNKWWYNYETSFVYVDPLESKEFIVAFSVPNEVKEKEADLNICLWSKKIILDLTEEPSETTSEEQNETSSED